MNLSNAIGFCLLLVLCMQIITGVLLATAYDCSWQDSFRSIVHIVTDVQGGFVVQHLHVLGALFYMVLLIMHWLRGCWLSLFQLHAYRNRPALVVGWVIFVLSLGEVFFGCAGNA